MQKLLFANALDLLPEPILIVAVEGDVVGSNRAARVMFEPIIGRDPCGLPLAALTATEPEYLARCLANWANSTAMTLTSIDVAGETGRPVSFEIDVGAIHRAKLPTLIIIRFRREHQFLGRYIELNDRVHSLDSKLADTRLSALRLRRRQRELKLANRRLRDLATHDGLTQLHNRRSFDSTLTEDWLRAIAHKASIALILLDVDNFKHYNDSYGHPAGDRCLQSVAQALGAAVRIDSDLAARYGGEEFAVILPDTDAADAAGVAQRILKSVRDLTIPHAGLLDRNFVTVSAGVSATKPQPGDPASALIDAADAALYQAKEQGRDRLSVCLVEQSKRHDEQTGAL